MSSSSSSSSSGSSSTSTNEAVNFVINVVAQTAQIIAEEEGDEVDSVPRTMQAAINRDREKVRVCRSSSQTKSVEMTTEVVLHVYDVTNSGSDNTNNAILQINRIFKDGIGVGGIFHSAVQVYGEDEWSFGFCEQGSGVFCCPAKNNPMYTYLECIVLGKTSLPKSKVNQIMRELSREWPGNCYDLLSRNCNHFCNEFCERLGVPKLPGWVNRFANAGDTAVEIAETTAMRFRQAKTEIVTASKVAYRFLAGISSNNTTPGSPDSPGGTNRSNPRFQQPAWFKNLVSAGAKPSTSTTLEIGDEQVQKPQQQRQEYETASLRSHEM